MRDGKAHLRLDRRLARRRGWISETELSKELESLQDVAEKGELVDIPGGPSDEGDEETEAPSETGFAEAAPSFH